MNTLNLLDRLSNFILFGFGANMSDLEFLEKSISRWKGSPERALQIKGFMYYDNEHDILKRKRTMIGDDGKIQEVENLPNNHIIDNQYAKLVNQKTNYLFGQPFAIETDNDTYTELLQDIFDKKFMRTIKKSGKYAYNGGIAWLYPFYNQDGELDFRLFPAYEILPFWADAEHEHLQGAVRMYVVNGYENKQHKQIEKVEVFDQNGIHCYIWDNGRLTPDANASDIECAYVTANGQPLNWSRIPLIPLKVNDQETPLLKKVKSLQDGINVMLSDFENNMQEDARNTILVLKNYDGTNLGEFRKNLATYGAVKVRYDESQKGGVETLEIQVNAENYKAIIEIFKKAIIENGMGYDAKDDRLSGNPNQMNIQSMYSDIDIDANDTETEYQAAFDEILWFVDAHLANTGHGNFEKENVNIIFNRDILINEGEIIDNCSKSMGILSLETVIGQHPWVDDPKKEMERIEEQKKKEQEEALSNFDLFGQRGQNPDDEGDDPDRDDDKGGD